MLSQTNIAAPGTIQSRIIVGGMWTFGGRITGALAAFGVNVLASRLAEPEHVGAYFLAASVAASASLIAQCGLQVVVVRRVAASLASGNGGEARAAVIGTLRVVVGLAVVLALAVGALRVVDVGFIATPLLAANLWLLLAWIAVLTPASLLAESFRGFHDYRLAALFNTTVPGALLVVALLAMAMLRQELTLHDLLACSVGAAAVSMTGAAALMALRLRPLAADQRIALPALVAEGAPLMLSALAMFIVTQADLWIVGVYRPPAEVATYGAAGRLLQFVMMPMLVVNAVVSPVMAEMYGRRDFDGMRRSASVAAAVAGLIALAVLLAFVFLAGPALGAIFGEFYSNAAGILIILGIGQTVNALCGPGAVVLMMSGHSRAVMSISLACGGALIAGALLLVDQYGATGVACSAAFATAGHGILSLIWVRSRLGVWTMISSSGVNTAWLAAASTLRRLHARGTASK